MKKTKNILSIALSLIIVISSLVIAEFSAFAFDGMEKVAEKIEFDTLYTNAFTESDTYSCDSYYFIVPADGTIRVYVEAKSKYYLSLYGLAVYNEKNISNEDNYVAYCDFSKDYKYNYDEEIYYNSKSVHLNKGSYYGFRDFYKPYISEGYFDGTYNISISYKADVTKPSTFKVATRNVNSLKLSWSKVGNVDGYQLQRKSNGSYKTITNTTATSYTIKNLNSATNYSFRVRTYKTVEGKKYYSSWKTLTTPTKPAKVSIKTPATNSKHQIIAKWNKVARVSGYQVQYCKNKSCSSVIATKTVSGQSKVSYTGKNFTKNKTYYIRVRAYKTVNNTKYYGAWSSVKSIKCK